MDTQHQTTLAAQPTAPSSTAGLPPAQHELLRQALADAIMYRDPPLCCPDCDTLGQLCGQCAAGLSKARAYLALSRDLVRQQPFRL
jgi:O-succinylbenzoate synthase